MVDGLDTQPADQLNRALLIIINRMITDRIKAFTNSLDHLDLTKTTGVDGKLPAKNGGFKDHSHDGTSGEASKLAEANTHEGVVLGPAPGAIHWAEAALITLIEAHSSEAVVAALDDLTDVTVASPVAGDLLRYNGTQWVRARPQVAVPVTNGDPDFPEFVFEGSEVIWELVDV